VILDRRCFAELDLGSRASHNSRDDGPIPMAIPGLGALPSRSTGTRHHFATHQYVNITAQRGWLGAQVQLSSGYELAAVRKDNSETRAM